MKKLQKNIIRNISETELINIVNEFKGASFASLTYETDKESANKKLVGGKKNPFYGKVSFTTTMGCQLGHDYEKAVNNRLQGEDKGTFVAESLPWGSWIRPKYLIENKGLVYVRFYKTNNENTKFERTFYIDGVKATDSEEKEILTNIREHSTSNRQAEVGISEGEQVKPFNVKVDNIISLTIRHTTYIINHKV